MCPHEHPTTGEDTASSSYDRIASVYDFVMPFIERIAGITGVRPKLCAKAKGETLVMGIGTGRDVKYLPSNVDITGIDRSTAMLARAEKRGQALERKIRLLVADAANLPFKSASFDTVMSTLLLCSVDDPVAVIREMARVCRPEGQLLLLEHGMSSVGWIGRFQSWRDRVALHADCHWSREPEALLKEAGIIIEACHRSRFGIVSLITARPVHTGV